MKEQFLALVEEVRQVGIVQDIGRVSNVREYVILWQNFADENPELFAKIREWGEEFYDSETEYLFAEGEVFDNPLEIVIIIRINGNEWVSEEELFERWEDLQEAIGEIDHKFAKKLAKKMEKEFIEKITPEDIFPE